MEHVTTVILVTVNVLCFAVSEIEDGGTRGALYGVLLFFLLDYRSAAQSENVHVLEYTVPVLQMEANGCKNLN